VVRYRGIEILNLTFIYVPDLVAFQFEGRCHEILFYAEGRRFQMNCADGLKAMEAVFFGQGFNGR
jgi:hypothetical protein